MDEEKKWLLMTYYCPIHGDSVIVRPIELTKKESELLHKSAKAVRGTLDDFKALMNNK